MKTKDIVQKLKEKYGWSDFSPMDILMIEHTIKVYKKCYPPILMILYGISIGELMMILINEFLL